MLYTNAISSTSAAIELRRRIAAAMAASNFARARVGYQAALHERIDDHAHALVDDQFSDDEQRQRQQETGVHIDVEEERQ